MASLLHEDTSTFDISEREQREFTHACDTGPLYASSSETTPSLLCVIAALSDEEKLLIAQEKRGKKVPSAEQQRQLLEQAHAAGHYGEKAMYAHLDSEGYWWPRMRDDIANEIKDCRDCQRYNISRAGFHPARSITAALPGDHYQVDLAELPRSLDDNKFILVLVDVFTGFVMLKAIPNKEAATVARAVWEICSVIGIPKILQSDNGKDFSNKIINALASHWNSSSLHCTLQPSCRW